MRVMPAPGGLLQRGLSKSCVCINRRQAAGRRGRGEQACGRKHTRRMHAYMYVRECLYVCKKIWFSSNMCIYVCAYNQAYNTYVQCVIVVCRSAAPPPLIRESAEVQHITQHSRDGGSICCAPRRKRHHQRAHLQCAPVLLMRPGTRCATCPC